MSEKQQEQTTPFLSIPSFSTVAKGTAAVLTLGMFVSAGFAAYNYWYASDKTDTPEDDEE